MMVMLVNNKEMDVCFETLMWDDADCAFIKSIVVNGVEKWVIFTAEGEKIMEVDNREQAFVIAKQSEFVPHSAH